MKTKNKKAILRLFTFVPLVLLTAAWDCEYCSHVGPTTDYSDWPACEMVEYSSAFPHCVDVGDASPEAAALAARECIWMENNYIAIQWTMSQGTAVGDAYGHHCEDYQIVDQGEFYVPDCTSIGSCLIYAMQHSTTSFGAL